MTIAYVKEVGTDNNNGTTAGYSVSVASAPSAGNTVIAVVRLCPNSGTGYSMTVTDSKSNTWTVDAEYKENFQYLFIASTQQNGGTLTTSDTVTFTLNMARSSNTPTFTWLEEFSGIATSARKDVSSTGNSSSATLLSPSATPTTAGDLVIANCDRQSNTGTYTLNGTGTVGTYSQFTTTDISSSGVGTNRIDAPVYQILSGGSGTAQKHAWTWSSGVYSDMVIVAYKAAASAATASAGLASATLAAKQPVGQRSGGASLTTTANAPTVGVNANAVLGALTLSALPATISTTSTTNAPAGVASLTFTARQPGMNPQAGLASMALAASGGSVGHTTATAALLVAAFGPSIHTQVIPPASLSMSAFNPTVVHGIPAGVASMTFSSTTEVQNYSVSSRIIKVRPESRTAQVEAENRTIPIGA